MKYAIFAFLALFLLGVAFADDAETGMMNESGRSVDSKANVIRMQYEKVACRVEFYKAMFSVADEEAGKLGKTLDADELRAKIEADKEALRVASESGDREAYNDARTALVEDVKEVARRYHEVKADVREEADERMMKRNTSDEDE